MSLMKSTRTMHAAHTSVKFLAAARTAALYWSSARVTCIKFRSFISPGRIFCRRHSERDSTVQRRLIIPRVSSPWALYLLRRSVNTRETRRKFFVTKRPMKLRRKIYETTRVDLSPKIKTQRQRDKVSSDHHGYPLSVISPIVTLLPGLTARPVFFFFFFWLLLTLPQWRKRKTRLR